MNQILYLKTEIDDCRNINEDTFYLNKRNKSKSYYIIFGISIILITAFFIYICFYIYNLKKKDSLSKSLSQSFSISTLYSDNNSYAPSFAQSTSESNPFIIGVIEIDKINLHYPILSYATTESLKISPARFAGPLPNEVGNLCIAGHNNIDNSFFGKLTLLDIGDEVKIYDLTGNFLKYIIYDRFEVNNSDFSCTSQDTKGEKIITLMTCNSLKDTRIIFKAKAE